MIELIKDFLEKSSKDRLSFFEYMHWALYAPGQGYYASALEKFGPQGDFITAPELTPLFAQLMAIQWAEIFKASPLSQEPKQILEFGAGSGKFSIDILYALEALGVEVDCYCILELSDSLKARQKAYCQKFERFFPKMRWLEALPAPESFTGIVFANEVLDAMPVHRFIKRDGKIWEGSVKVQESALCEGEPLDASPELLSAVRLLEERLGEFPEGYQSEVNLWIHPWLKGIYHSLKKGAVILVDYGYSERDYYAPPRDSGTLMAYANHSASSEVLSRPGMQDLTAHVNFSAVAEAAIDVGFELSGYTTQGLFLANLRQDFSQEISPETSQHFRRLVHPEAMGEIFKVMMLGKGEFVSDSWKGFQQVDQLYRL